MGKMIGIDLGTTNSLVSYWDDVQMIYVTDENGNNLFPSAVYFEDEQIYVGKTAKEKYLQNPANGVLSFKRDMGTDKTYEINGTMYTPVQLSAMVLKYLKELAEKQMEDVITEAVITVPAYFNDRQRSDTQKAAKIAGLKVERLINEPSAAALAYLYEKGEAELNLLVFDFGGGTLDLSYVECFDNVIEIIAVSGNNRLGGDDVDASIFAYISEKINMDFDLELCEKAALKKEIEEKKELLSVQSEVEICGVKMNNDLLFDICAQLFVQIRKVILRVLEDAGVAISEVDDFILVGGSSKLRVVQKFLKDLTGKAPILIDDCDRVVARGAGVYAGIRERRIEVKDYVMTDVCPFTLGTDCMRNENDEMAYLLPVIPRNSTLPCMKTVSLETLSDFQRRMDIGIYQGEEYYAEKNTFLGHIVINVPPKKAGEVTVSVSYTYDINGILHVVVVDAYGRERSMLLKNQEMDEADLLKYQKEMERVSTVLHPWKNEAYLNARYQLEKYFENASGERKEYLARMLSWYIAEMESQRIRKMHLAYEQILDLLNHLNELETHKDEIFFDLKWNTWDEEEV